MMLRMPLRMKMRMRMRMNRWCLLLATLGPVRLGSVVGVKKTREKQLHIGLCAFLLWD